MPDAIPSGSLLGVQVPAPKGPGSFIGAANRALVMALLRAFANLQVKVPLVDTAGNYLGTADAQITMSGQGCVVTLPKLLNPPSAGGGGSGNMVWKFLWYSGVSAKPNEVWALQIGTATGTYIALTATTSSPDSDDGTWFQLGTTQGQWQ